MKERMCPKLDISEVGYVQLETCPEVDRFTSGSGRLEDMSKNGHIRLIIAYVRCSHSSISILLQNSIAPSA